MWFVAAATVRCKLHSSAAGAHTQRSQHPNQEGGGPPRHEGLLAGQWHYRSIEASARAGERRSSIDAPPAARTPARKQHTHMSTYTSKNPLLLTPPRQTSHRRRRRGCATRIPLYRIYCVIACHAAARRAPAAAPSLLQGCRQIQTLLRCAGSALVTAVTREHLPIPVRWQLGALGQAQPIHRGLAHTLKHAATARQGFRKDLAADLPGALAVVRNA